MTRTPDQPGVKQLEFNFPAYSQREDYISELDFTFHLRKPKYAGNKGKVKSETLAAVLGHIGKYRECFESQERICKRLKIDERKLQRAIAVLRALDILVTDRKSLGNGGRTTVNHHRVNWEQIRRMIDDQHQPDSSVALITQKTPDQPDSTGSINPTVLTDQPDSTDAINPTVLSLTLYRELKENELKESTHSLAVADSVEVVVRALVDLDMSPAGSLMTAKAAFRRGLTENEIDDLISYYRELSKSPDRPPKLHVGWLSRWLDGQSKPPVIEGKDSPQSQNRTANKEFVQRESLRVSIFKQARQLGWSQEQLERCLRENGFED